MLYNANPTHPCYHDTPWPRLHPTGPSRNTFVHASHPTFLSKKKYLKELFPDSCFQDLMSRKSLAAPTGLVTSRAGLSPLLRVPP